MARRFRKRPVTISAVQWTGHNLDEIAHLIGAPRRDDRVGGYVDCASYGPLRVLYIRTTQGVTVTALPGEWIVPEEQPGRAYPIAADVFANTYDEVTEAADA